MQQYITTTAGCGRSSRGPARTRPVATWGADVDGIGAARRGPGKPLTRDHSIPEGVLLQRYAAWLMQREPLDVDAIDAFLQAFDRTQGTVPDDDEHAPEDDAGPADAGRVAAGRASLRWLDDGDDAAADAEYPWEVGSGCDPAGLPQLRQRRHLRRARRLEWGLRPGDLPELVVPAGYRLDHRHHWRYATTGRRVPGARHRTLDLLWDFGRFAPVLVPQKVAACAAELAWCAAIGEWDELAWAGRTVPAWRIDADDWDDRARYSLGLDAPELAADRLLGVGDVAQLLGVGPSTVTSYLSRGRLPAPQARVGGRPAWSAPVLLHALSRRP